MYSQNFERAVRETLYLEGVFSDDSQDPGGKTKYGITEGTWRAFRQDRDLSLPKEVEGITVSQATDVYYYDFWCKLGLDKMFDKYVAAEVFDSAVNCGPGTGAKMLQRAINYCRREGWDRIAVDGQIGPQTRLAVDRLVSAGHRLPLLEACNGEQYIHYRGLDKPRYSRGWTRRLAIAKELG